MTVIVVTGASGFIGTHMCARVASAQQSLWCVGNHGVPQLHNAFTLTWAQAKETEFPPESICVHFAGPNSVSKVEVDSKRVFEEQHAMADFLLSQFRRTIFISSAAVYQYNASRAVNEEDPVDPKNSYAKLKLELEAKFIERGQPVARLANVIGKGMSASTVMSTLAAELFGQSPVVKIRSKSDVRDFIHVDDVTESLLVLAQNASARGVFNIGTGIGHSIEELYATMAQVTGIQKPLVVEEMAEATSLVLDRSKAEHMLGWVPKTNFASAVKMSLANF